MAGGFWGGFAGSFAQGLELGRRARAQSEIEDLDDEVKTSYDYDNEAFNRSLALPKRSQQGNMLEQEAQAFADDPEAFGLLQDAALDASPTATREWAFDNKGNYAQVAAKPVSEQRQMLARQESVGLQAQPSYTLHGITFDAQPSEYDRMYAKQNAIADIYAKTGFFEQAENTRARALDARARGEDLAHRKQTRQDQLDRHKIDDAWRVREAGIADARWEYEQAMANFDRQERAAQGVHDRWMDRGRDARADAEFDRRVGRDRVADRQWWLNYGIEEAKTRESFYQNRHDRNMDKYDRMLKTRAQWDSEKNSALSREILQNQDWRDWERLNQETWKFNMAYFDWWHEASKAEKLREVDAAFRKIDYDINDPHQWDNLFDLAVPAWNNPAAVDTDGKATRTPDGTPVLIAPDGKSTKSFSQWIMEQDPLTRRAYAGVMHMYARASVTGEYDKASAAFSSLQTALKTMREARGVGPKASDYSSWLTALGSQADELRKQIADIDDPKNSHSIMLRDQLDATNQLMRNFADHAQHSAFGAPTTIVPVGASFKGQDGNMYIKQADGTGVPAVQDKDGRWVPAPPPPPPPPPAPDADPQADVGLQHNPRPTFTGRGQSFADRQKKAAYYRRQEQFEDQADDIIRQIKNAPSDDEAVRIFETNRDFLEMTSRGTLATDYVRAAQVWLHRRADPRR